MFIAKNDDSFSLVVIIRLGKVSKSPKRLCTWLAAKISLAFHVLLTTGVVK